MQDSLASFAAAEKLRSNLSPVFFRCEMAHFWCNVVYSEAVAQQDRVVRQSISLPSAIARRVKTLAKRKRTSANRVIVDLIETGLEAREHEKRAFFELAERLARSSNAVEQKRLKEELARMTFGE